MLLQLVFLNYNKTNYIFNLIDLSQWLNLFVIILYIYSYIHQSAFDNGIKQFIWQYIKFKKKKKQRFQRKKQRWESNKIKNQHYHYLKNA